MLAGAVENEAKFNRNKPKRLTGIVFRKFRAIFGDLIPRGRALAAINRPAEWPLIARLVNNSWHASAPPSRSPPAHSAKRAENPDAGAKVEK